MAYLRILPYLIIGLLLFCCHGNPNMDKSGKDVLEQNRSLLPHDVLGKNDTVYVPIYSSIYSNTKDVTFLLTATLSIRNTSLRDTIYIEDIDYFDTHGTLVREYLEFELMLKPMESIDYVIEEEDNIGGTGANFLVTWGAKNPDVTPLFQGIMISTNGQQGISFLTEGISISR